ncbi:MAG TPA: ABC transporter ATP-binding protein, partial [Solirubrobacteraceae bacterium]|nr:ABC transporter ATP-binding protein [Solirubrobacteraceae bacterium]
MTGAAPVLRARGVAVARAGVEVVRHADVDLHAGEVVVLIGPNGAGKSTLLSALGGLLPVARGDIERSGRVAAALQAPALARRSARANVEAALGWWGVGRAERRERALAALSAIGARHLADRPAGTL